MNATSEVSQSNQTEQRAPAPTDAKKTIGVTSAAVDAMRTNLAKRGTPDAAIRIGIRGGGCSGFSYVIEFDDDAPRKGDLVLEFPEEGKSTVRVYCDKKSILYLGGSVLDWEKTLMFQGFKFKNPKEASRCGCGHSFTVG
ncbi:HesB/IscA family protein [Polyangium fumosum]|uniref:Iron-sulfur cluster assembly accessory protein n=1 Tax=Polyangium fumosum TaxID=889272 RepID=A0A4U1J5V8_9BACT|nr:iron-sulfur cluster assembly accessory protein [Polyangium fumosum]TKD02491.1 iron-sulfur cluster assembly accessory protein [Polyangium fumosum]